jgi:hypothetical protein
MTKSALPFALPRTIEPALAKLCASWAGLTRGGAEIPFADDLKLSSLAALSGRLILIEAFEKPARFRFNMAGAVVERICRQSLAGRFIDEIEARAPLSFLNAQCSATVETGRPTYFRQSASRAYARLLLPLWGDGHISLLLGAVADVKKAARAPRKW